MSFFDRTFCTNYTECRNYKKCPSIWDAKAQDIAREHDIKIASMTLAKNMPCFVQNLKLVGKDEI